MSGIRLGLEIFIGFCIGIFALKLLMAIGEGLLDWKSQKPEVKEPPPPKVTYPDNTFRTYKIGAWIGRQIKGFHF